MRSYPTDDDDRAEVARLEAPEWMVETLRLNPSYVHWGPHEDYMWKKGEGWDSPLAFESWTEFGPWELEDYNEVVNFYFSVERPTRECDGCNGTGHHPDAQWITESWYHRSSPFTVPDQRERDSKAVMERFGCVFRPSSIGRGTMPPDEVIARYGKPFLEHCVSTIENGGEWSTNLTEDEVDALFEAGRLWDWKDQPKPTAAMVNERARQSRGFFHDAINSWICTRRRCERLGVPYTCPKCDGHTALFTGSAYLAMILWVLHPRKGASRGAEIKNIQPSDLEQVFGFLRIAAARNAERFSRIPSGVASQR